LFGKGLVGIQHGRAQRGKLEQPRLGPPVAGHVAVIVEMIAGQIGKDRRIDIHAVQTPLIEGVRGRLHADEGHGLCGPVGQRSLQRNGSGVVCVLCCGSVSSVAPRVPITPQS
jgi:hypothetical protein